jgi:hypothetical protein
MAKKHKRAINAAKSKMRQRKGIEIPKLTNKQYFGMPGMQFEKMCNALWGHNKRQLRNLFPEVNTSWMYIDRQGRMYGFGEGNVIPSAYQTREGSRMMGIQLFLIRRNNFSYCDSSYFMRASLKPRAAEAFGRGIDDFHDYNEEGDGVVTINAQSGIVEKLIEAGFAVGRLKRMKPLVNPKDADSGRYSCGATTADVYNVHPSLGEKVLYIASQNAAEVHKRGSKVRGERENDKGTVLRVERLHRLDDPVLDIIVTYEMRKPHGNPLILHGTRAIYDRMLDRDFWPKLASPPTHPNHLGEKGITF